MSRNQINQAQEAQRLAEFNAPTGKLPDEADSHLATLFQKLEADQLDYLDQAGKRIIELSSALLGVLFAVIAFGENFPPAYLQSTLAKGLVSVVLVCYLLAIMTAVYGVQPRDYKHYRHNLTEMQRELNKVADFKARWARTSGLIFVLGSAGLALLVGVLVW
ncbi:MAG: hypothetical protein AAF702_48700 [Chloroflexota bacterium]